MMIRIWKWSNAPSDYKKLAQEKLMRRAEDRGRYIMVSEPGYEKAFTDFLGEFVGEHLWYQDKGICLGVVVDE